MSNTNYTHIVVLVDNSGSMFNTRQATVDGINNFLNQQKVLPSQDRNLSFAEDLSDSSNNVKCTTSVVFFSSVSHPSNWFTNYNSNHGEPVDVNHNYVVHFDKVNINDITSIQEISPVGGTPLIDAFCKAIDDCTQFINVTKEEDRPGRIIFLVITDGAENSSTKFKKDDLSRRIADKQSLNWQFIYLGANQDAIQESSQYSVAPGQSLNYQQTSSGIAYAYSLASSNVLQKRCVDTVAMFTCSIDALDKVTSTSQISFITNPTSTNDTKI